MPTLDWIGKRAVVGHHLKVPYRLLRCDRDLSTGDGDAGNLLVQGDNLEALRALVPYYGGQVKCAYIDPPYNTGRKKASEGGWFYDDRVDSPEIREWLGKVVGEEGEDLSRHDKWLCMMYPRLKLLHALLSEEGVLFVSIDDNEHRHLHCLLDEIFGSSNHLGTIIWHNATDNNPTRIAVEHEYVVCFAKNKDALTSVWKATVSPVRDLMLDKARELIADYGHDEQQLKAAYAAWFRENKPQLAPFQEYDQIDAEGGIFTGSRSVHNPGKEGYRYDILHPVTGLPCKEPLMGYRFPEETAREIEARAGFIYGETEDKIVELKLYLTQWKAKLSSIYELDGRRGANQLSEVFEGQKVFNNPKPVDLVADLISFATGPNDIIVDSFAGSGTTGHAVLRLNAEARQGKEGAEGEATQQTGPAGGRRFVLIERDPETAERVTKPRLDHVIDGGQLVGRGGRVRGAREGLGGGFRFCRLGETLANPDGTINPTVGFRELAAHVFFSETGSPLPAVPDPTNPLLGVHRGDAVYLLTGATLPDADASRAGILDARALRDLPTPGPGFRGTRVVYGDGCLVAPDRLKKAKVVFKQVPYQIDGFQQP